MAKFNSKSIAGNITTGVLLRRLFMFLVMDALIGAAAMIGWCYAAESAVMGSVYPSLVRRFAIGEQGDPWSRLGECVYMFGNNSVSCGTFLQLLLTGIGVLGMAEILVWSFSFISVYFDIKKQLRPLNTIAENTVQLLDNASSDKLESELSVLDPLSNAHISTGNRELKGLETAINDMLDKMREAYRVQARFVSDASHELRTPIAVIKGYADMLSRWGKEDEEILTEGITSIRAEADNMNRLVEQLLFLARADNGRQTVKMSEISLNELVEQAANEFTMIDDKHTYSCEAEEITVSADHSMIKECMRILMDNAKKYTPEGGSISVKCFLLEGHPCLEVRDTGIGVAPDDIPHMFDRFFRSDPARTREGGGTGLGLAIAKQIADYHKAYFNVDSYEQIGTRIRLIFEESIEKADEKTVEADG